MTLLSCWFTVEAARDPEARRFERWVHGIVGAVLAVLALWTLLILDIVIEGPLRMWWTL